MSSIAFDDFPPNADAEDIARWKRLRHTPPVAVAKLDIDDATAALYSDIRQSPQHGPLMHAVECGFRPEIPFAPHVLILPGAFHRHHADTGADGRRVREAAARLGWTAEVLPVGSLSSMAANAQVLIDTLRQSKHKRHLIVSLSKGSADVAMAMRHANAREVVGSVIGWVSLSGLTLGTPLVDWLMRQRWRMPGIHLMLWWMGLRFREIEELRHGPIGQLHTPPLLPDHVRAIHVVGFPRRKHLRHPWAGRGYRRLMPLGPNDGGGILLSDVLRLPGQIYPVWGADHYLDPAWDFTPFLDTLLCHAAMSQPIASTTPAAKSTK